MIKLRLTFSEAQFLQAKLARLAEDIDNELVHTDARAMQHSLAFDAKRLQQVRELLDRAIDGELDEIHSSSPREMQ